MEQVKITKVKKEVPKFNEEDIEWYKYKKKSIPIRTTVSIDIPPKGYSTWGELKELLITNMDRAVELRLAGLKEVYDFTVLYYYGQILIEGNRLESGDEFKKRVIEEARNAWLINQAAEKNAEVNKKRDLATYERIKKKHGL